MSTTSEPEYRLPLPTPVQARSLAEGIEAAVSPAVNSSLEELAMANASGDARIIEAIAAATVGRFATQSTPTPSDGATCKRFTIYDAYFLLNRLPDSAPKCDAMEALTVALAVVMKDAAKTESERSGVTPIEFGILRQSLAVVIEVLTETPTNIQ